MIGRLRAALERRVIEQRQRVDAADRRFAALTGRAASVALDGAMHSVWLHGDWRWLTRNMTTEQREAAADAVERYWVVLRDGPEDDVDAAARADLRWWRQ